MSERKECIHGEWPESCIDCLQATIAELREAARDRVESGHDDACLCRLSGPCFCGHDALVALLEKEKGDGHMG